LRGELDGVGAELTTSWSSSFDKLRRDLVAERAVVDARVRGDSQIGLDANPCEPGT
jgi:hypothetical protein